MSEENAKKRGDRRILSAAMSEPLLDRDEELDLARRWREDGDTAARDRLVSSHQRLVVGMARRFERSGIPFQDLYGEGNIGLIRAIDRFDPESGNRLSTYAGWWIYTVIQEYVMKDQTPVRLGRARSQRDALRRMAGRPNATDAEIADAVSGVDEIDVSFLRGALHPVGFDGNGDGPDGGDVDYASIIPDGRSGPERMVDDVVAGDRRAVVERFLEGLDGRERSVLRRRHLDRETCTLRDIADEFDVSPERVRQIERGALEKLCRRMTRAGYCGEDLVSDLT